MEEGHRLETSVDVMSTGMVLETKEPNGCAARVEAASET